ncbi:MAG TPA: hypothetical protein VKU39_06435 [Streptosporangiaceae bacterium]|nr:hypothetical protein [Streptosporangiaceae bacterium]
MNEANRDTRPPGRKVQVKVYGDTADEIEMSALDQARPFFGDHAQLMVVHDYRASSLGEHSPLRYRAAGKRYVADVTVRAVEPDGEG